MGLASWVVYALVGSVGAVGFLLMVAHELEFHEHLLKLRLRYEEEKRARQRARRERAEEG